jgi:hypothetical protein
VLEEARQVAAKKTRHTGACGGEAEVRKQDRVLTAIGWIYFQSMGELMPANDSDLMRRSWHSAERERRAWLLFLDRARSDD